MLSHTGGTGALHELVRLYGTAGENGNRTATGTSAALPGPLRRPRRLAVPQGTSGRQTSNGEASTTSSGRDVGVVGCKLL